MIRKYDIKFFYYRGSFKESWNCSFPDDSKFFLHLITTNQENNKVLHIYVQVRLWLKYTNVSKVDFFREKIPILNKLTKHIEVFVILKHLQLKYSCIKLHYWWAYVIIFRVRLPVSLNLVIFSKLTDENFVLNLLKVRWQPALECYLYITIFWPQRLYKNDLWL